MVGASFEERLAKYVQDQKPSSIDWSKRRDSWLQRVEELISDVERWIEPVTTSGAVRTIRAEQIIDEEFIGKYGATKLIIWVGDQRLCVCPKGTLIIGSLGRVMVEGPYDDAIIDLNHPGPPSEPGWKRVDVASWHLRDPRDRQKVRSFREDTFKSMVIHALRI